jgi:CheY-like chemotaxis protein
MDGYEVARRLRLEATPTRPVLVAMTGYGQEADCRKAREAGFDRHLVKPVDSNALQSVLAAR